jgi:hypothetical protein
MEAPAQMHIPAALTREKSYRYTPRKRLVEPRRGGMGNTSIRKRIIFAQLELKSTSLLSIHNLHIINTLTMKTENTKCA